MAPAEIATIAENEHGSAFEVHFLRQVKIKSPGAETAAKTAARLRLESYAEAEPLPRLLGNSRNVTKRADQRADKARQQNEQKKEVVEKVRMDLAHTTDAKRNDLAQQLEKAQGLREGALSNRKERAAQHYEKVMKKKDDAQQQVLMTTAEAKQRMADALAQKETLRGQTLAEITNRATKYNEKWAQKVQEQQQVMETKRLQSKELPADQRLMNLSLRLYEHHMVACPR